MINKLNPLGKFICTIGNLPSSYTMSLTYEEQLLWLCNYIENTVIPAINNNAEALQEVENLFNQLKSYVDNYFDNLDIQNEINGKLDTMAQDGTLANIINVQIFNDLNEKIEDNFNQISNTHNLHLYGITTHQSNEYAVTQGGCIVAEDTVVMLQNKNNEENNGYLKRFNYKTGVTSQNVLHTDLQHGQSMCFNASQNIIVITSYNTNHLKIVDADTLLTINTINLDFTPCAIAYEKNMKAYFISELHTPNIHIFTDEFEFASTIYIDYLQNINQRGLIDLAFNGSKLMAMNMYEVFEIDKITGETFNHAKMSQNVDYNVTLTEPEFFDYESEDRYVVGGILYPSVVDRGWGNLNSIFAYYDKNLNYKRINSTVQGWINKSRTIYVDNTSISYYRDGSEAYPYINIYEAINACSVTDLVNCRINLTDNYSENKPVVIIGTRCKAISINANSKNINGFLLEHGVNLNVFGNPNITPCNFSNYFQNQSNALAVLRDLCNLYISPCTSNNGSVYIDNGCKIIVASLDIDFENTENYGELNFKQCNNEVYNPSLSSSLGLVKNRSYHHSENNLQSYNMRFPANGGFITVTFEDNTRETIQIANCPGSVGSGSLTASFSSHSYYVDVALSSSKPFKYVRACWI